MAVEIRIATAGDVDAIRRVFVDALDREPVQRAALADLLYDRPPADPALRLIAADDGGEVVGVAFGSVHGDCGFVDAIAVPAAARRLGFATVLLTALEDTLRSAGAKTLKVGGNTWYYAWPGVDLRYTAALGLFENAGYRQVATASNMTVALDRWVSGQGSVATQGALVLRRARPEDVPQLQAFALERFTDIWAHELRLAVQRDRPSAFVAVEHGAIVGFACHGVYRADWFGPLGVDPDRRGSGIGEALLRLCLDDLAAAGVSEVQICWIGPARFYSRAVGARIERVFALLEK